MWDDPCTAPSPFPMPDSRSLMPTIPAHIAQVISRATQLQPELRFGSITELQQALFNPANNQPTQYQSGYGQTQVRYDATQVSPTGTQVMPGTGGPPNWPGEPNGPASYAQNSPQYQVPPGRGYTQVQFPGGTQGAPHNTSYPAVGNMTPWPTPDGGSAVYPQKTTAPPTKNKTGIILAIIGMGVIVIGLCIGAFIFGQNIFDQVFPTPAVIVPETVIDNNTKKVNPVDEPTATLTTEPMEELTKEPTNDPDDGVTPTATVENPQATESPTPTNTPTEVPLPEVTLSYGSLGNSVQGRELSFTSIGYENAQTAVVVIGSIQGDQTSTRDLVNALINYYTQNPEKVPVNTRITLIPSINPDGNALGSRYNAHDVDLNRNWNSSDWKSNAAVPGYPDGKPGSGGTQPFSEPETKMLRNYINTLKANVSWLRVFILHNSVRLSSGEIYPGGNNALGLSSAYASASSYAIENSWAAYVTSGEAVTWCEEHNILAIDVVIPASQSASTQISGNRTLLDITVDGLRSLAEYR